jgi:hypothetical protein
LLSLITIVLMRGIIGPGDIIILRSRRLLVTGVKFSSIREVDASGIDWQLSNEGVNIALLREGMLQKWLASRVRDPNMWETAIYLQDFSSEEESHASKLLQEENWEALAQLIPRAIEDVFEFDWDDHEIDIDWTVLPEISHTPTQLVEAQDMVHGSIERGHYFTWNWVSVEDCLGPNDDETVWAVDKEANIVSCVVELIRGKRRWPGHPDPSGVPNRC